MGSQSSLKLTTIDLTQIDLKSGTPEWESVKLQVKQAVEEYGCFEVVYDKVSDQIHKELYSSLEELFDLPLETKLKNMSPKPLQGYISRIQANPPTYESLSIEDAQIFQNIENFTNTIWPQGHASFSKTIDSYTQQVTELDKMARRMILESFGMEKYVDEHLASTTYRFRVMHYKGGPQRTDETCDAALPAHTDSNFMTILSQNQVHGLQIQTKDGQWINVTLSPNSFVVMTGDSLSAWSNGRLHSPVHRVVVTANQVRYSTGVFAIPKAGYMVKAPEELVDEEHPLLYKPYDYYKYIDVYMKELMEKGRALDLKAYCAA